MLLSAILMSFCGHVSDECGIVAQISEPLATADIPAYYISTFKFDHALVSSTSTLLHLQRSRIQHFYNAFHKFKDCQSVCILMRERLSYLEFIHIYETGLAN